MHSPLFAVRLIYHFLAAADYKSDMGIDCEANDLIQHEHLAAESEEKKLSRSPAQKFRYWTPEMRKNMFGDNVPLPEAAKLAISVVSCKTPVTILQELLSRRGTSPKYELVQIEGAIHEPTFRYRVAFGDSIASGTGRSKKEAKHAAAKNLLNKLVGNQLGEEGISADNTGETLDHVLSEFEDNIPGNPIGTLQEMCLAKRWPPPVYEITTEEGPPHERQFTITCVLLNYREVGSGKSKKLAKRQAANKMWEKLQECSFEPSQVNSNYENGQKDGTRYVDLRSSKGGGLSTNSHKVSSFHKIMQQSTGVKLNSLQTISIDQPDNSTISFLQEIASEQNFQVTFVDIEEKSFSGQYQCLVQLSTFPVAVCYGSAHTVKEAQEFAAQNALEYLKVMTKKKITNEKNS